MGAEQSSGLPRANTVSIQARGLETASFWRLPKKDIETQEMTFGCCPCREIENRSHWCRHLLMNGSRGSRRMGTGSLTRPTNPAAKKCTCSPSQAWVQSGKSRQTEATNRCGHQRVA